MVMCMHFRNGFSRPCVVFTLFFPFERTKKWKHANTKVTSIRLFGLCVCNELLDRVATNLRLFFLLFVFSYTEYLTLCKLSKGRHVSQIPNMNKCWRGIDVVRKLNCSSACLCDSCVWLECLYEVFDCVGSLLGSLCKPASQPVLTAERLYRSYPPMSQVHKMVFAKTKNRFFYQRSSFATQESFPFTSDYIFIHSHATTL